jgi:hypothetical protein
MIDQDELFSALLDPTSLDAVLRHLSDEALIQAGDEAATMRSESVEWDLRHPIWTSVVKAFERQLAARFGRIGPVN